MEEDSSKVVNLSGLQRAEVAAHRCGLNCSIQHVCGNLYICKSTGMSHICDKNCDQRIVYDNHTSICRASRQVFPLQAQCLDKPAIQGVRRKNQENEGYELDTLAKRNRCFFSQEQKTRSYGFPSPYLDMPYASSGESSMDVV
ncbi:hypothetical protein KP509_38G019900 [Ceratopteris richardii]|nr:hypothetical protein KP509_38G019900 [Ceratopteris richardii]